MALEKLGSEGSGTAFLVSAGIVYEIVAAACSSPQTTEINAATRGPTLMKWVHLGLGQAALFVAAAAILDRRHRRAIIAGGGTAMALMYGQYVHAHAAGIAKAKGGAPGTEQTAAAAPAAAPGGR